MIQIRKNARAPWASRRHILGDISAPFSWSLQWLDIGLSIGLMFALTFFRNGSISTPYLILALFTVLLMLFLYNAVGVYSQYAKPADTAWQLFGGWCLVILALIFITFVTKTSEIFSRQVILTWWLLGYPIQQAAHLLVPRILRSMRDEATKSKVLIIGAGKLGRYIAEHIDSSPWLHQKVIGVISKQESTLATWDLESVPKLGTTKDIEKILKENHVDSIYLALPISESAEIESLYEHILETHADIFWVPDTFDMILIHHNVKEIDGFPVLALVEQPITAERALFKSIFDMTVTCLALLLLSPLMLVVAAAIKITSPGPVLYQQERHGWNEEIFKIWKFRSMLQHKENDGIVTQATKEDPRITPVGRFIRRTSIDELPQLFNVLAGDMSLVGPRPHAVEHDNFYAKQINAYLVRHNVKPGITGLAQVNGYRGETDTLEKMQRRVEFDLNYINNWSPVLDMIILYRTLFVIVSKNAY